MTITTGMNNLLHCLGQEGQQQKQEWLAGLPDNAWQDILPLARRHGLLPLLTWRLKPPETLKTLPAWAQEELRETSRLSAIHNLHLYQTLGQVLEAFHQAEIPVVVLKGAYLAEHVYEHFALRPMADADLLLRLDDLEPASQLMQQLGYTPYRPFKIPQILKQHHHLPPFVKPDSAWIELHWTIVLLSNPVQVDLDGVWDRSTLTTIAKAPARVLSPEDLLLHLCLHICQDNFSFGLKPLVDVAETISVHQEVLNWQVLLARAAEWKANRCLALVLHLTQELLSARVPESALQALRSSDFDPIIALQAQERVFSFGIREHPQLHPDLARLWGNQPLKVKVRAFRSLLFPPQDVILQKYPAAAKSRKLAWYYLVRLADLLKNYRSQVFGLASGDEAMLAIANEENAIRNWWSSVN